MSTPELLYGERDVASLAFNPAPLDLADRTEVVLADVEIFYSLFEIRMAAARALLPPGLHPSVPALMGITFIRADSGPFGAFCLAYLGPACRTGIKPRHLVLGACCNAPAAADFFSRRYDFDCREAEVDCHETYDRVHGCIALDGITVLDLSITHCVPLVGAGATVKYSPPLNAARAGDGNDLVQFEAVYDFKRVIRGGLNAAVFDAAALAAPGLTPTDPIAGTHAVVDLTLLPVRFAIDAHTPAEAGGARRIKQ